MLKVLIVEDSEAKAGRIFDVIVSAGVDKNSVGRAGSSTEAKALLRNNLYDVLILDINIPRHTKAEPIKDLGLELLREVEFREKYQKPTIVIGVTEYADAYERAAPIFDAAMISIVKYSRESDDWKEKLFRRMEYLVSTKTVELPDGRAYDYDVAILTALDEPELSAVRAIPWQWKAHCLNNDDTTYFIASPDAVNGKRVVAASSPFMGMPCAAVMATKMIAQFRPRFMIHCGITAGIRGRSELGDVIVADPSWDWGSGKMEMVGSEPRFAAGSYQIMLREEMRGKIRRLASDDAALALIRKEWPGTKPSSPLTVRLGPLASGASVLADNVTVDKIKDQHRKLLGVEMETYGVMAAAEFCNRPRPTAVSLKSVCDFADPGKADDFQGYAAYTSARCAKSLIENYLF